MLNYVQLSAREFPTCFRSYQHVPEVNDNFRHISEVIDNYRYNSEVIDNFRHNSEANDNYRHNSEVIDQQMFSDRKQLRWKSLSWVVTSTTMWQGNTESFDSKSTPLDN